MLRFGYPGFVLSFLLGIAVFAIFEAILSHHASHCTPQQQQASQHAPHQQPTAANQQGKDGDEHHSQKAASEPFVCTVAGLPSALRTFMNRNEGFFVGSFTFMLVFVTAWLVWATLSLRESTDKMWEITKDAAERTERSVGLIEGAWIFANPVRKEVAAKDSKLRMLVKNQGKTPGLITRYHMEFRDSPPKGTKAEYGPVDETKAVWICGPLDTAWPLPHEFDWDHTKKFAVGFVEYETAFGPMKRTSRFCYDLTNPNEIRQTGSPAYNSFRPEESES
jgi:hypothetical protein